eukprot:11157764-Lingulodinium_polyedra.AAC.1
MLFEPTWLQRAMQLATPRNAWVDALATTRTAWADTVATNHAAGANLLVQTSRYGHIAWVCVGFACVGQIYGT